MKYQPTHPITRVQASHILKGSDKSAICDTLVDLTHHDDDWKWLQDLCLVYAEHEDEQVACVSITCLGHIARIHGEIDKKTVLPFLEGIQRESLKGTAEDAIEDIERFCSSSPSSIVQSFSDIGFENEGMLFFRPVAAIKVIEALRAANVPLLGLDAFRITEQFIQPDMEHSLDLSNDDQNGWDISMDFLEKQKGGDFLFEIVLKNSGNIESRETTRQEDLSE